MMLLFSVGDDRFGLEVKHVVEIVPYVALKPLVGAPECVAGLLSYRDDLIPVVDLSAMLIGRPSEARLSTRIVLVKYPAENGVSHIVGMLVERATETVKFNISDFSPSGVGVKNAKFISRLATHRNNIVQCVSIDKLLPRSLQESMYFSSNQASGGL